MHEKGLVVVGVRAYLVPENVGEHAKQIREIRKAFPDAFILYVSCGLKPPEEILTVANESIHYSDSPQGVGIPTEKIVAYALEKGFEKLVVIDGDLQHKPEQIAAILRSGQGDVAIPQRKKRILFSREKLDGKTIEDLENAFLRTALNVPFADVTPGAFVFQDARKLKGFTIGGKSWIGDYILVEHCVRNKLNIVAPEVDVHSNVYTISNKRLVFREIEELEKHYGKALQEIAVEVRKNPYSFLHGGTLSAIDEIIDEYRRYKYTEKISKVKALILAGGKGTRLKPFTDNIQKQVFPIANKPILHFVMDKITNTGISEIGVVVGPNKDQIMNALGDGSKWNAKITYIEQDKPAGLAHAVLCAKDFLKDSSFLMYLGDNMINDDLTDFLLDFVESGNCSITLTRVKDPSMFGIIELDSSGKIERLVEKPKHTKSDLGVLGIYAFNKKIFDAIAQTKPSPRGELEIVDAIQKLVEMGEPLHYRIIKSWWVDTGSIESMLEANALVLDQMAPAEKNDFKADEKTIVKGRVEIGRGCEFVNSTIIGPVSIGENTRIENSVIGPYTTLGKSNIIKNSSIIYSLILDGSKIDCAGELSFSVIGRNTIVKGRAPAEKKTVVAGDGEVVTL